MMIRVLLLLSLVGCSSHQKGEVDLIAETIASKRDSYLFCFKSSQDYKNGLMEGKVKASFVINQLGNPTEVKLLEKNVQDPQFEKCLLNTISNLKFTPPANGKVLEIKQPFNLKD